MAAAANTNIYSDTSASAGDSPKKAPTKTNPVPAKAAPEKKKISTSTGGPLKDYFGKVAHQHRDLELALINVHMKETPESFVQKMFIFALLLAALLSISFLVVFFRLGLPVAASILLALVTAYAVYRISFGVFLNFPVRKFNASGKRIEHDIIFAARDIIISLRSGLPLFNAIIYVSSGYGDASLEFRKIIERVQVGMSLVDALDEVISETKSPSFRRLMLQASVSIKSGADIVGSLQAIINQLTQERIIATRSYGQKLNAIAMFYMLFGIILPSMGMAVITIFTTFISFFTVNATVLIFALFGIFFLQVIFLALIQNMRPAFSSD